jgi:hypothetical protein
LASPRQRPRCKVGAVTSGGTRGTDAGDQTRLSLSCQAWVRQEALPRPRCCVHRVAVWLPDVTGR